MTTTIAFPLPDIDSVADAVRYAVGIRDRFDDFLDRLFEQVGWAENEIEQACARHLKHVDRLQDCHGLLLPTHQRMKAEFVFRSHCRELLDRVAAGQDPRPGTAAEVCCSMSQVSVATPMQSAANGLYLRMWRSAGFPSSPDLVEASEHHEALEGAVIDDHERFARRRLAVTRRRLPGCERSGDTGDR